MQQWVALLLLVDCYAFCFLLQLTTVGSSPPTVCQMYMTSRSDGHVLAQVVFACKCAISGRNASLG